MQFNYTIFVQLQFIFLSSKTNENIVYIITEDVFYNEKFDTKKIP